MTDHLSAQQFHDSEGVEDWRVVGDGACAYFPTTSFAAATRFVQAISELSGSENHRPDIDVRRDGVTVRLLTVTDDYYGPTSRPRIVGAEPHAVTCGSTSTRPGGRGAGRGA